MTRRAHIGFDRRIELAWLDAAASQAAANVPPAQIRAQLWNVLDGVVRGAKFNSARGKTVTVLNRIWGEVPVHATGLRERASSELEQCTRDERVALHWAMMVGTYPLFSDVAAAIGRLLVLQGHFTLAHLTRRLAGAWGQRSTLERAAQRIVRSMVQWGVLRDTATRGRYESLPGRRKVRSAVGKVLIEALLLDAEDDAVPFEQLIGHPALFPFEVELNAGQIRKATQFRVHRQGLDSDYVELQAGRA